jgi:hypothetical protein
MRPTMVKWAFINSDDSDLSLTFGVPPILPN